MDHIKAANIFVSPPAKCIVAINVIFPCHLIGIFLMIFHSRKMSQTHMRCEILAKKRHPKPLHLKKVKANHVSYGHSFVNIFPGGGLKFASCQTRCDHRFQTRGKVK